MNTEPKNNEEKKNWETPTVVDYDIPSVTDAGNEPPPDNFDGLGYS
jgi:hypothetical protein